MKISVSLSRVDVEFLDAFAEQHRVGSRSAVIHQAVELLRYQHLAPAYREAFSEWSDDDEAAWESASADGISST